MKKTSSFSSNSRTAKNLRQLKRKLSRRKKANAEFQYDTLEPKLPLDASFFFNDANGGFLSFDNFTPAESVFVTRNGDDDLVATLTNGTWQGGFADDGDGTVNGNTLVVEGGFDDFFIQGLADGSVVTFSGSADLGGAELDISGAVDPLTGLSSDFSVFQNGSGGGQSGFDVDELRVTGGTSQFFDTSNRSQIGNLILNNVTSFELLNDNTINAEFLSTVDDGSITLTTEGNVVVDTVNVPGTLAVSADGNVVTEDQNSTVEVGTFIVFAEQNLDIIHLRASEIAGNVEGNFTVEDSNRFLNNVDTTIINSDFISASGTPFFFPGLLVEGNLDWEIRFSSLTQHCLLYTSPSPRD